MAKDKKHAEKAPEAPQVDPLQAAADAAMKAADAVKAGLAGVIATALQAAGALGATVRKHAATYSERYVSSGRAVYSAWHAGTAARVDWTDHVVSGATVGKVKDKRSKSAFIKALDLVKRTGDGSKKIEQQLSVGELLAFSDKAKKPLDVAGVPVPGLQNLPRCWRAKGGHTKDKGPSDALAHLVKDLQSGDCKASTGAISKRALGLGIMVNGGEVKAPRGRENCPRCSYFGKLILDIVKARMAAKSCDMADAVAEIAAEYNRDPKQLAEALSSYNGNGGQISKDVAANNAATAAKRKAATDAADKAAAGTAAS